MYCLEESRFITSEIVGIKLQMVHFINFIQREVTVTHFKAGPLMRFFVPESNQDREIIFALWFTTCRRCSTSQTFQKSINFMKKALFYVSITLKKIKQAKVFSWKLARLWCWNSRYEYSFLWASLLEWKHVYAKYLCLIFLTEKLCICQNNVDYKTWLKIIEPNLSYRLRRDKL